MPEKLMGWIALAIFVALAIGFPLILLGVPKEYIWPLALSAATIMLIVRPGGTADRFLTNFFAYALVFAIWCVAGVVVTIILHLIFGIQRPTTIIVVLLVGAFGVVREATKSQSTTPRGDA
jgi:hypothetical protein